MAHQACVLRADLEKSQNDNASLFLKIGKQLFVSTILKILVHHNSEFDSCNFLAAREDKLNADNRSTVNSFQFDLAQLLDTLSSSLVASVSRQRDHLQCVENLCNSFLQLHDKVPTCCFSWLLLINLFTSFIVVYFNECS